MPLNPLTDDYEGYPLGQAISGEGTDIYLWNGYAAWIIDNAAPMTPGAKAIHPFPNASVYLAGSHIYHRYLVPGGYNQVICVTDLKAPDATPCAHPVPMSDPDFFDREVSGVYIIAESKGYAFIRYWKWRDIQHTDVIDVHDLNAMRVVHVLAFPSPTDARVMELDGEPYAVWGVNDENAAHPALLIQSLRPPFDMISRVELGGPTLSDMKLGIEGSLLAVLTRNWIPQYDLRLFDLSDPAHPQEVGRYRFENAGEGIVRSLEVAHGRVYVGIGRQVWVVDISDPAHPVETGVYVTSAYIHGLHARPPILSLALGDAGMMNLVELSPAPPLIYLPLIH